MSKSERYGESQPRPYRGGDRRSVIRSRAGPGRLLVAATAVLLAIWTAVALGLAGSAGHAGESVVLGVQLHAAAAALGVVAAMLCLLRWRLVGDAAALWLGAGALLLAGSMIGTPGDVPGAVGAALGWLPPALRLVAVGLLWHAARTPQVDTGLRPARVLLGALAATGAGVALFTLAPGLARNLASFSDRMPGEPAVTGPVVLLLAWLALAVAHGRRGRRERNWLHLWFGLVLLALALAEALWLLPQAASPWAAGPAALAVYALLCAAVGATWELARAFNEQRGRLFETVTSELAAEAKVRAEQLMAQERAHEARNALTAIEGASRTLETYRDRLDPETRISLSRAISNEIARLQRLVSPEETTGGSGAFVLADTLTSVVIGARAQGMTIDTRVPQQLVACGRPGETAEVVQNLIENARRYAPGSRVVLRAHRQDGGIVVRVEDRGPGVVEVEREAIFRRGYRGDGADSAVGTGLGLYICARLMREQGGDLWVEDRPGGGASFALWLPEPVPVGAAADGESGARAASPQAGGEVAGTGDDPATQEPAATAVADGADQPANVFPLFGARRQQPAGGEDSQPEAGQG